MPGDPTGMPATANPMAGGRSDRRRLIADAGTWPSMTYTFDLGRMAGGKGRRDRKL